MSPIASTLVKVAFLAVLWLFVIAAVGVMRADLFGSKAATKPSRARKPAKPARPPRQAPPPPRQQQQPRPAGPMQMIVTEGPRAGLALDLRQDPSTIGTAHYTPVAFSRDDALSRDDRLVAQ